MEWQIIWATFILVFYIYFHRRNCVTFSLTRPLKTCFFVSQHFCQDIYFDMWSPKPGLYPKHRSFYCMFLWLWNLYILLELSTESFKDLTLYKMASKDFFSTRRCLQILYQLAFLVSEFLRRLLWKKGNAGRWMLSLAPSCVYY